MCKRHDAAPVLFDRAASAAGAERRLGGCEQVLDGGPRHMGKVTIACDCEQTTETWKACDCGVL